MKEVFVSTLLVGVCFFGKILTCDLSAPAPCSHSLRECACPLHKHKVNKYLTVYYVLVFFIEFTHLGLLKM